MAGRGFGGGSWSGGGGIWTGHMRKSTVQKPAPSKVALHLKGKTSVLNFEHKFLQGIDFDVGKGKNKYTSRIL
jgi:hypothetical protein